MTTPAITGLLRMTGGVRVDVVVGNDLNYRLLSALTGLGRVTINPVARHRVLGLLRIAALRQMRYDAAVVASEHSEMYVPALRFFARIPRVISDRNLSELERSDIHRVDKNVLLVRQLFPGLRRGALFCPFDERAGRNWVLRKSFLSNSGAIVAVHPGSDRTQRTKRVSPDAWRRILFQLRDHVDLRAILVVLGPGEFDLRQNFEMMRIPGLHIVVESLETTAGILTCCDLMIAADSGMGHVAAAVNCPVLSIVGPTDYHRTRPWGQANRCFEIPAEEPNWSGQVDAASVAKLAAGMINLQCETRHNE